MEPLVEPLVELMVELMVELIVDSSELVLVSDHSQSMVSRL